ncbi:hypothetical protein ACNSOO_04610 [Aliarcobacter lanthieri]|uniref:hypothetical protein n=1 Tax=Aliarcobacter lanthieri TaxID=1355374 RepID=UPI003AAF64D5
MKEIIYKDIANYIHKSEQTIRGYKVNNPDLLEILKIGAFCKHNDLDIEKIKKLVDIQEAVKGVQK